MIDKSNDEKEDGLIYFILASRIDSFLTFRIAWFLDVGYRVRLGGYFEMRVCLLGILGTMTLKSSDKGHTHT